MIKSMHSKRILKTQIYDHNGNEKLIGPNKIDSLQFLWVLLLLFDASFCRFFISIRNNSITLGCVLINFYFFFAIYAYLKFYFIKHCFIMPPLLFFSFFKLNLMFSFSYFFYYFFFRKLVIYLFVGDFNASLSYKFKFYLQVSAKNFLSVLSNF